MASLAFNLAQRIRALSNTAGSLLIGGSGLSVLNPGADGKVLTMASGTPSWQNPTFSSSDVWTGQVRTGDTSWITAATHAGWSFGDYFKILSVGTGGKNGGVFFTHTADVSAGSAYWCLGAIAVNDNTAFTGSYAAYLESYKQSTAHVDSSAHGLEIDVVNRHSTVGNVHPYNPNSAGITEGLRVINQQLGIPAQYDGSVGMSVVGDGTVMWKTGLNFANGSCRNGQAISMPAGYGIWWYTTPGGITGEVGAQLYSHNTVAGTGMRFVFHDGFIMLQNHAGDNKFLFKDDGLLYINATTAATAGSIAGYLPVKINNTDYKLALYNV